MEEEREGRRMTKSDPKTILKIAISTYLSQIILMSMY